MLVDWGFALVILFYSGGLIYFWLGWEKNPYTLTSDSKEPVSILIAVRNEASHISKLLKDLSNQTYKGAIEIVVINDHSTDNTLLCLKNAGGDMPSLRVFNLKEYKGKKAAIELGVRKSTNELLLTIDGDCRVGAEWVAAMVGAFSKTTQLVSGPVMFNRKTFFEKLQQLEFLSLVGSGGSFIGWAQPVLANGANLAFKKAAFYMVNGYDGNKNKASGDDVFLLHKINNAYSNAITFAKNNKAIVTTFPQPNLGSFVQQRVRWAGKWRAYSDVLPKAIALVVFLQALAFIVLPIVVAMGYLELFTGLQLVLIKLFFDFIFYKKLADFFSIKIGVIEFFSLQLIYPIYVVFSALLSFKKHYIWKGRKVS